MVQARLAPVRILRAVHAILLCAPVATLKAEDLGGVIVKLEGYEGPATVLAQAVEPFNVQITVNPGQETKPLAVRVELPHSGPRVWPAADVEVRDAQGKAMIVRRPGIEWFKLLIRVPPVAGSYFVQAAPPAGGKAPLPSEKDRVLTDGGTGLRLRIAPWYDGRKAALSIRFDDSHPTHLTKAIPILREYGFRGTFMINPGAPDFETHRPEWEAVARPGDHELANHTAHHRGAVGDEDMEAEIGQAARAIWELTPGKSKLMALNLGGGTHWETTWPLRYYLDKYHQFEISGSLGMDDVYGQRVIAFRRMLEQHIERGLWCRVHYHSIGHGLSASEANFRAALDAAREHAASLWIAGMADIYKYQTERSAAKLALLQSDPKRLAFELTCLTDATLYDQPLTLEVTHPQSPDARRLKVEDAQGNIIPLLTGRTEGASLLRFNVAPRNAVYSIEMRP